MLQGTQVDTHWMSESSDSESPPKPKQPQQHPQKQQQHSPAKHDVQKAAPRQNQQQLPSSYAADAVAAAAAAGAKLSKEARDALVHKLIQVFDLSSCALPCIGTHHFAGQTQARGCCCTAVAAAIQHRSVAEQKQRT
jgi:hypothetical protein